MKILITSALILFVFINPAVANPVSTHVEMNNLSAGPFDFFRAHRQGSGVSLLWATTSTGVIQFVIERSYDGEFFDVIGGMGYSGAKTYKFSDNNVYPGYIHYRITSVKSNGTKELSAIETVRIVQRG